MKLIIAGSRRFPFLGLNNRKDWKKSKHIDRFVALVDKIIAFKQWTVTEEVSGVCWGIDLDIGEEWARRNKIPIKQFPADWDKYGKKSGHLRNIEMGYYGDVLCCIRTEESSGSQHMVELMKNHGKDYHDYVLTEDMI